jgi:hypothetical protein
MDYKMKNVSGWKTNEIKRVFNRSFCRIDLVITMNSKETAQL